MVQISSFVGVVALLSTFVAGLPRPMPGKDEMAPGIEVHPKDAAVTSSSHEATPTVYKYGAVEQKPAEHQPAVNPHVTSSAAHQVTSSAVHQVTSSPVHVPSSAAHIPSSVAHVTTEKAHVPTPVAHQPPAESHAPSAPMPTHGSGSSDWGNPEYNDCVSKCLATYGQGPAKYVPSATNTPVVQGTGATHTVIVAPTQGVLRYIPFAVNASVGDTIKFMWGANNHTVTKSSALLPCNRTGDALFTSGRQDGGFVFTQVVNDTNPTYFHCAVPNHCQQGMFGIVNPTTNFASPSSVGFQMQPLAQKNSAIAAYADITTKNTAGNPKAALWGSNIDMAAMPDWAQSLVAENVLYTRNFLASNPEVMKEDGSIDLSTSDTVPFDIPEDIAKDLNNAGNAGTAPGENSPSTPADVPAPPTPSDTVSTETDGQTLPGAGVSNVASPKVLLAIVAVVTTLLL